MSVVTAFFLTFKFGSLKKIACLDWIIVMYYTFPAINLNDWFELLTVWEQSERGWRRLCTVRPQQARKLCTQPNLLAFPTSIDLNPRNKPFYENYNFCKYLNTKNKLLEIIELCPGQTSKTLAKKLGVTVPQIRQHLRKLQETKLIYYCPDSSNKKIKKYYLGEKPLNPESNKNLDVVDLKPTVPQVRVYFVNSRLLQKQLQQFN